MTTVNAAQNPALANDVLAQALAVKPAQEAAAPPTAPPLPQTKVDLPGGFLNPLSGDVTTTAEVRELNGVDEEAIARSGGNVAKLLDTILTRGVVRIGDLEPDKKVLDSLLAGDREALILGVRVATFGDELDEFEIACPACEARQSITLSCTKDIPTKVLEDPVHDRVFSVTLPSGKTAQVRLPDGEAQKAVANSTDTNYGVLNTLMLSKTVTAINGMPVFSPEQVRALGIRDREAIIRELAERNCGPRLREVSRSCTECSESIPLPLSLTDLFRY